MENTWSILWSYVDDGGGNTFNCFFRQILLLRNYSNESFIYRFICNSYFCLFLLSFSLRLIVRLFVLWLFLFFLSRNAFFSIIPKDNILRWFPTILLALILLLLCFQIDTFDKYRWSMHFLPQIQVITITAPLTTISLLIQLTLLLFLQLHLRVLLTWYSNLSDKLTCIITCKIVFACEVFYCFKNVYQYCVDYQ